MSLQELIDRIAKQNSGIASQIKSASQTEIVRLPLASYGLTKALGGGIAKGRVTTIYGTESSGKSLLMQQSIGRWQKEGLTCAWVDAEGSYDKEFCARLGVNNDEIGIIDSRSSG